MSKKKIIFIVNPNAGAGNKKKILKVIESTISVRHNFEILYWEDPTQDVSSLARKAAQDGAGIVVAVGGDGTVNAIAQGLIGSESALAVIPAGSGNGLARHLGIPLDPGMAIGLLEEGKVIQIDTCSVNDKFFICTAGTGFDAHIGKLFSEATQRGFFTYFKLTLSEFMSYKPQAYELTIDDKRISTQAFLITFANANQYGNNAFIAPMANITDGLIEVCILKPFRMHNIIGIAAKLFNKRIATSVFYEHYSGKNIGVKRTNAGPVHYDGEPCEMGNDIVVSVKQKSLRIVIPIIQNI